MSYQEEEPARLKRKRSNQAIALAMQGRWREAVAINRDIIANFPRDVDAYNRLGKALMELGEYSQAKEAYEQTLKLDSYNAIAKKNLLRLSRLGAVATGPEGDYKVEPQYFIEEIGKSGVVNLYRLAPPEVLARMVAGDKVFLKIGEVDLGVENGRGEYLGLVDPKHGQRLVRLIEGGNKYEAAIVNSMEGRGTVIIREVYQHPNQVGRPSFPSKRFEDLRHYLGDRLFKRELEYEREVVEKPGYTIVSTEPEAVPQELLEMDYEDDEGENEEE